MIVTASLGCDFTVGTNPGKNNYVPCPYTSLGSTKQSNFVSRWT